MFSVTAKMTQIVNFAYCKELLFRLAMRPISIVWMDKMTIDLSRSLSLSLSLSLSQLWVFFLRAPKITKKKKYFVENNVKL